MKSTPSRLAVVVDGTPLDDAEARAFWERFSAHLETFHGDLGGFATSEGFESVSPEIRGGVAVLVVSRSAPQGPYDKAPRRPLATQNVGGSAKHQGRRRPSSKRKRGAIERPRKKP